MSAGIIYRASGEPYVEEAETSAKSVKKHNPTLPVTIYTDENPDTDVFDSVVPLEEPLEGQGDSILSEHHFPYEKNLYLDNDTYVCGDIIDVFKTLGSYDLAIAHNAGGGRWNERVYERNGIELPSSFAEYNTGVMAYNNCTEVRELFADWYDMYHKIESDYQTNQPALRVALFHSNVRVNTLLPKFNFQLNHHRYARGDIKILHNSGAGKVNMERFEKIANSTQKSRIISRDDYPYRVVPSSYESKKYKLKNLLYNKSVREDLLEGAKRKQRQEGIMSLVSSALTWFSDEEITRRL